MTDVITGVAILTDKGVMIALPRPHRHHHIFALAAFLGMDLNDGTQGFVTDKGVFVNRRQAMNLVVARGQKNRRSGNPDTIELYSEDVW